MSKIPGILKAVAVLLVVVAIGVAIGLMSSSMRPSKPAEQPIAIVPQPEEPPGSSVTTAAPPKLPSPVKPLVSGSSPIQPAQPDTTLVQTPVPQNVITNWESRLDDILDAEVDEDQKARQMSTLLPNLPEEGQIEVAQHLANLTLDEDYELIGRYLTNSALSEEVLDVFLSDSLNRPNEVKLPLLLEVARNPQNPKAEEAREILELFLEEDYGNDWALWKVKLDEWIKDNPD